MVIYSIIPLLIIITALLIKKISIKRIINGLFWGIISVALAFIIDGVVLPIFGFSPTISELIASNVSLSSFIISLFIAALPEEISKFISIKFSNVKEKNSIFINSILIGITFACIENYIYINNYGFNVGLTRMLQPGHLFFQIVMALLLIKALNNKGFKKILFNILAIILPMLCHAMFNTFNSVDIISYIFYAVDILTYIFAFYYIIKLPTESEKTEIRLFAFKLIVVILAVLFIGIIYTQKDINNSLNEIQNIQEDNIELKVISSEKVEIDNDFFGGNYIKVKVELKNNNNTVYVTDMFHFHIADNLNKNDSYLVNYYFDDCLNEIGEGETSTGYLYFKDEGYNYSYLIYTAGEFGNYQFYNFDIE